MKYKCGNKLFLLTEKYKTNHCLGDNWLLFQHNLFQRSSNLHNTLTFPTLNYLLSTRHIPLTFIMTQLLHSYPPTTPITTLLTLHYTHSSLTPTIPMHAPSFMYLYSLPINTTTYSPSHITILPCIYIYIYIYIYIPLQIHTHSPTHTYPGACIHYPSTQLPSHEHLFSLKHPPSLTTYTNQVSNHLHHSLKHIHHPIHTYLITQDLIEQKINANIRVKLQS